MKLHKDTRCIHNDHGYTLRASFKEKYEDNLNPKYDLETLASRTKHLNSMWNKLRKIGNELL